MSKLPSMTDEELVDLLDAALWESRDGSGVGGVQWRKAHPDLRGEAAEMAEMLFELSRAVRVWRSPDLQTVVDDSDDNDEALGRESGNAVTLLVGKAPRKIGRYQLRRHVGSGAMGDVYEAHDPQLDRCVAVKVPRCDRMSRNRSLFTERFVREARAAAAVRHAHICPIYDAGETDGQPWVVMAFVEGQSLDAVLSKGRIEDIRHAVQIAIQVADALSAIHQHGIIHRDLKPGNILIDGEGQALLTDFGLALSDMNAERITCDGLIVGTPVYMSPEQAAGENSKLTPAADIYSLGAVLFEMLTGEAPFRAPLPELLRMIMLHPVPPVAERRREVDPELAAVVSRMLSKIPAERFSSAAALADALRGWLGSITSGVSAQGSSNTNSSDSGRSYRAVVLLATTVVLACTAFISLYIVKQAGAHNNYGLVQTPPSTVQRSDLSMAPLPTGTFQKETAAVRPEESRELKGQLKISISSNPTLGTVKKNRMAATEDGALPLVSGELVQFDVKLNQPAYVYLLWVNPDGTVAPLYPWDSEHHSGWDAPILPESRTATDHLLCPNSTTDGFEASEPAGLQTVVLLARRQPLEDGVKLAELLSGLPATPSFDSNPTPGPILRGITTGKTKSIEDPQYNQLKARLSPHFELINVMSFPHVAQLPGPEEVNSDLRSNL